MKTVAAIIAVLVGFPVGASLGDQTPPTSLPASNAPANTSPTTTAADQLPAVQIDVSKVLNTRAVTTLSDGKVIPFEGGVDDQASLAIQAAVTALSSDNAHNLPDDGHFPATADHPEVILHYSNGDATSNQVRRSPKGSTDDFAFDVPSNRYEKLFLFFTSSSSGSAPLDVTLSYQDGSTDHRNLIVPDWYAILKPADANCVYLATNLAKWTKQNTLKEKDHHSIFGLDVQPDRTKALAKISVHKTHPIVVFWGATGQPIAP